MVTDSDDLPDALEKAANEAGGGGSRRGCYAHAPGGGDRIMPGHVNSAIFDMRGESGDPGAIVWADGSRGVRGLRLDISAG